MRGSAESEKTMGATLRETAWVKETGANRKNFRLAPLGTAYLWAIFIFFNKVSLIFPFTAIHFFFWYLQIADLVLAS